MLKESHFDSKDGMYNKFTHYIDFFFLLFIHVAMISISLMNNVIFFRAYVIAMQTRNKTRRLLKYDPGIKKVTMSLRGLSFSNGVALNKDKE